MNPQLPTPLLVALVLWGLALLAVLFLLLGPRPEKLPMHRRRPEIPDGPGALTKATGHATALIDKILKRRGGATAAAVLEQAGVKMRLQEVVLLIVAGALVTGALGVLLTGSVLAVVVGIISPLGVRLALGMRISRRQRAFADQLDDSLQLMASSLRAGHSLLQALASVSREAEEPTADEFARIINETRVGRPLGEALDEAAERMSSEDFVWVTQAIAINREVGGNLADVLDGIGHTIRERNQIKRQVKALSAEGTMSALVLMALPVGITAFLMIATPEYLAGFTQSLLGYGLIVAAVVMMAVGALWLRKVVSFKF